MAERLPTLRKDLEIVPRIGEGGAFRYLIKEVPSGEIFEFGEAEYFLCEEFGRGTSAEAIQRSFQERFGVSLPVRQLEAFGRRLEGLGLAVYEGKPAGAAGRAVREPRTYRLLDPDRLLGFMARNLSWCFSRPALLAVAVAVGMGIGVAFKFGGDFLGELLLLRMTDLLFLAALLGLFVITPLAEIAKGVACKRHGGTVHAFTMSFAFRIVPHFFCEVADAMWFMGKAERAKTLQAGLVLRALLWSIGIIAWKNTESGTPLGQFWVLFTLASTVLFLLRINPVGEQEGYYLLSNRLDIPDLHNRAKALAQAWIFRRPLPEPLTPRELVIFKRFGLPALIFEIVFWGLVLGFMGYHLIDAFKGVGACLFSIFLLLRFEDDLRRFFFRIPFPRWSLGGQAGGAKLRLLVRFVLLSAFVLLMFVPYPFEAGGSFRLLPVEEKGIRAQITGDIVSVFVEEGQWVEKGQPVARFSGREQKKRVEEVKASLDQERANLALLEAGAKPEEIAKARQEVQTAAKSLEYTTTEAGRAEKMFKEKALSEKDYLTALRFRDMDRERLALAKKNLELVKSGFRDESITAAEARIRLLEVELVHAEEDLELTTLLSPMAGRIITPRLAGKVGQFLAVGDLFAVVEVADPIIADIEVPEEDIGEVEIGVRVKLRTWAYPNTVFWGRVVEIAPVAYEKSRKKIERAFSEREWLVEQNETIREKGKVVRVLSELPNKDGLLKTDMTGYAKIQGGWKPVGVAFTRWLIRFLFVEVWSWIP